MVIHGKMSWCHLPSCLASFVFNVFIHLESNQGVDAFVEALHACKVERRVALVILEVGIDTFCQENVYHLIVSLHRCEEKQRIVFLIKNVIQISLIPFQHVFHQPTVPGGDSCVHALHKLGGLFFLLHIPKLCEMLTPRPWSSIIIWSLLLSAGASPAAFSYYHCLVLKTHGITSFSYAKLTPAAFLSAIILFIIERLYPPDSFEVWRWHGSESYWWIKHWFVCFVAVLSGFENALEFSFFNYLFDVIEALILCWGLHLVYYNGCRLPPRWGRFAACVLHLLEELLSCDFLFCLFKFILWGLCSNLM